MAASSEIGPDASRVVVLTGRWVGLSYDGPIISGWGTIARTEGEVTALIDTLRTEGKTGTR